jgi:hypothetical protein
VCNSGNTSHRRDYPPHCSNPSSGPLVGPRATVAHATGKERDRREQKHRSKGRPGAVVSSVFVETYQSDCLPPRKRFLSPPYHPLVLLLQDDNPVHGRIPDNTRIQIPNQAVYFFSVIGDYTPINHNSNSQASIRSVTDAKGFVEQEGKKKDSEREEGQSYL